VFWLAPRARFRIYTKAADYLYLLRDLVTGRAATGDDNARLEQAIGSRCDVPYAICVPQARVGIYLAVKSLIKPGQKVVLSPYTIADVINMVICAGGVPVFADIDRLTTSAGLESMEPLLDEHTGAVMVTHLHGIACDIESIAAMCTARRIPLIEDAAQAFGARVGGKSVGTFGDIGVFSFGMYKNITAFYGGAMVMHDPSLHAALQAELQGAPYMSVQMLAVKALKALVTDLVTMPALFKSAVYWIFRHGYLHDVRAINTFVTVELDTSRKRAVPTAYLRRLLPVQARMVLRHLGRVDEDAAVRIRYAKLYHDGLSGLPGLITPPFRDDGSYVYNYFPVQCKDRAALVRWMMQHRRDVAVQHLKNCASLPSFAPEYRLCPNAELTAAQVVLLPNYPEYGEESVRRNIAVIRLFFERGAGHRAGA
jgi:dTDP-4-amino-4,6-dideoxygalactose transaminase